VPLDQYPRGAGGRREEHLFMLRATSRDSLCSSQLLGIEILIEKELL